MTGEKMSEIGTGTVKILLPIGDAINSFFADDSIAELESLIKITKLQAYRKFPVNQVLLRKKI